MVRCAVLATLAALAAPLAPLAAQHHGLDPANTDTTCRPCTDFNRYANGGWLARTQLDAQHASYGSFTALSERNQETPRPPVNQPAPPAPPPPTTTPPNSAAPPPPFP